MSIPVDTVKLTDEQVGSLLSHQRNLNDLQAELDKAEFCGVDCTQLRAASAEAVERIGRLLANYGPEAE